MKVHLITRTDCLYCNQAKTFLEEHQTEYTTNTIGVDITREEVLEKYPGQKVVPIIIIDDVLIGSYENLIDYFHPPLKETND